MSSEVPSLPSEERSEAKVSSYNLTQLKSNFIQNVASQFGTKTTSLSNFIQENYSSEYNLLQAFKQYFQWVQPPEELLGGNGKFNKSTERSIQFRESGNLEYSSNGAEHISKAIQAYNSAIAFAPTKSEELGLAFGNRSAVFAYLNEYQLALKDIELAFEHNVPMRLHKKLADRRQKCLDELGKLQTNGGSTVDHLFTLKHPNPKIPCVETSVDIKYEESCGRKLVVTKDVPAGTVLLVERPYVVVLEKELDWDLQHCHYCYRRILGGIPCTECTFATFCDSRCLTAAMPIHEYDHRLFPLLHLDESHQFADLMAHRIVTKAGSQLIFHHNQQQQQNGKVKSSCSTHSAGYNDAGIYESSYHQIYSLISLDLVAADKELRQDQISELLNKMFKSFHLANTLYRLTNFFQQPAAAGAALADCRSDDSSSSEEFLTFISAAIFHHLNSIKFNAVSFSELLEFTKSDLVSNTFATGLFPTLSLVNHSCVPNAIHVRNNHQQHCATSLISVRPLYAGEEVTITYGPKFQLPNVTVAERRRQLEIKYKFNCNCVACVHNWTSESTSSNVDDCVDVDRLTNTCKNHTEGDRRGDKLRRLQCRECLGNLLMLGPQIDKYDQQLHDVYEIISRYEDELKKKGQVKKRLPPVDWADVVERLKPFLQFFGSNFYPTYNLVQIGEELYKKAIVYFVLNQKKMT